jgi:hypothetical protein
MFDTKNYEEDYADCQLVAAKMGYNPNEYWWYGNQIEPILWVGNPDAIRRNALTFKYKTDFLYHSPRAVYAAKKLGIYSEVCAHFIPKPRQKFE